MTIKDQRSGLRDSLSASVERPGRYIGGEYNSIRHPQRGDGLDADFRICLLFPDIYDIGIPYHGYHILYHILNGMEGVFCERSYLPWSDMQDLMSRKGVPLFSVESGMALSEFDAVGITLQTELHYPGVVKSLDLAGIPRRAADRTEKDPLVIGGGPCAFHPEPVAPFFDAFLLGDAEEALPEMIELMRRSEFKRASRREKALSLAGLRGVYVPGLYSPASDGSGRLEPIEGVARRISARTVTTLKSEYYPTNPIVPFVKGSHDRLTVEIMRGCTAGCRFCQAGMLHRPLRERPVADIINQVLAGIESTGWNEVGLLSLSTSDYSQLEPLLSELTDNLAGLHTSIAFPSLRPSSFSEKMAGMETGGRKSGLTFAVEAGSQRLRDVINKGLAEEELIEAVVRAYQHGWRVVKLYFMVGLPTERMDDIDEGAGLIGRLQKLIPRSKELHLSVAPFIPKPHSVFAREEFLEVGELQSRMRRLYRRVSRRSVKKSWHDPKMSMTETLLARGDRRMADAVEAVANSGYGLEAWGGIHNSDRWQQAMENHYPSWRQLLKPLSERSYCAWDHLSRGISKRFLRQDRRVALSGETLKDCRVDECYNCGLMKLCDRVSEEKVAVDPLRSTAFRHPQRGDGEQLHAIDVQVTSRRTGTETRPPYSSEPAAEETRSRYRLTFSKLRGARYLGHHDLMGAVLKALRRSGTPLHYRQGFTPRPRVSYGPALPLGHGADGLWMEFVAAGELDADEWLPRWRKLFPPGIRPLKLERVTGLEETLSSSEVRTYRLRFNRPVSLTSDHAICHECFKQGVGNWSLNRSGRTLRLQVDRRNGSTIDPVRIGLRLVGDEGERRPDQFGTAIDDEQDVHPSDVEILSVTQINSALTANTPAPQPVKL